MNAKNTAASDAWYARPADKTSQTDDQRIKDITVLPPPEHLIRFFFKMAIQRMEEELKQKEANTKRFMSFLF